MKLSVEYKPKALADLEKLTQGVRDRIISKINSLADNFYQITPQRLTGDWVRFFKLQVDYPRR
jgi:mRNA interferase RelE/StbE